MATEFPEFEAGPKGLSATRKRLAAVVFWASYFICPTVGLAVFVVSVRFGAARYGIVGGLAGVVLGWPVAALAYTLADAVVTPVTIGLLTFIEKTGRWRPRVDRPGPGLSA